MSERRILDGCSDGGCVIVKPVGMHTNGGCRCLRYPENVQKFRDELAALKASRDRLQEFVNETAVYFDAKLVDVYPGEPDEEPVADEWRNKLKRLRIS